MEQHLGLPCAFLDSCLRLIYVYIYIMYISIYIIYIAIYISDFFHLDGDHGCKLCLLFGCGAKELNDNERASALSSILLPCTQPSDYLLDSLDLRFFLFAFSGLLCELHQQADTHDARRSKREEGPAVQNVTEMVSNNTCP